MPDDVENIIRRWVAEAGDCPPAPRPPTDECLTFDQAAERARTPAEQEPADDRAGRHLAACPRCRHLVAEFREALAEGPPIAEAPAFAKVTYRRFAVAAAAAILLLGAAATVYLATRPRQGDQAILASADVGLQKDIASGMTPKGAGQFATGDAVMLRVRTRRPCFLALVNVPPVGRAVHLPLKGEGPLCEAVEAGERLLGPYRLTGPPGEEVFVVIAFTRRPEKVDLAASPAEIERTWRRTGEARELEKLVRSWRGEARIVRLRHAAGKD